jgi:transglutaminase-like putative cysteine protease
VLQAPETRHRFWEYLQTPEDRTVARAVERIVAEVRDNAGEGVTSFLMALNRHVHCSYTFDPRATEVTTPLTEVLSHRRGVCQDFAHLMLAVARTAGIPARYVSGYLHVEPRPETIIRHADGGAMHAWVEAHIPNSGWVGFDPTHGLLADHHYVRVGVGREYADVPPTRGLYRGVREHKISVLVEVSEIPADEINKGSRRREAGLPSEGIPSSGAWEGRERRGFPRINHRVVTQRC